MGIAGWFSPDGMSLSSYCLSFWWLTPTLKPRVIIIVAVFWFWGQSIFLRQYERRCWISSLQLSRTGVWVLFRPTHRPRWGSSQLDQLNVAVFHYLVPVRKTVYFFTLVSLISLLWCLNARMQPSTNDHNVPYPIQSRQHLHFKQSSYQGHSIQLSICTITWWIIISIFQCRLWSRSSTFSILSLVSCSLSGGLLPLMILSVSSWDGR